MQNQKLTSIIPHIAVYGKTNSGKSSLINALLGQNISVVSPISGTTTDIVQKRAELIPYGPVVFIDTPGFNDNTELGTLREEQANKAIKRTDLSLILCDSSDVDEKFIDDTLKRVNKYGGKSMIVFTKNDLLTTHVLSKYANAITTSIHDEKSLEVLRKVIISHLDQEQEPNLLHGLLGKGATIVHVTPIDSAAPKGRLILPQTRTLRECLDNNYKSIVVQPSELKEIIDFGINIDLVITDSQSFKQVASIIPKHIALTSYSILFARNKGDISELIDGANHVDSLTQDSKILIAESCTHNISHEDIGKYKIPALLEKRLGFKPNITHVMGHDFPSLIEGYDFIIHCGSCMVNRQTMLSRIKDAKDQGIPITNYGLIIAKCNDILVRATEILYNNRP